MSAKSLDWRDTRLLELLSSGSSAQDIAHALDYKMGTVRVYLHNLYKKIGVSNKTEAAIWYLNRDKVAASLTESTEVASAARSDLFGDMAIEEGLHVALGVMGAFIGPFNLQWEAASKLKGVVIGPAERERAARARSLWRAVLEMNTSFAKRAFDEDQAQRYVRDSSFNAVMLHGLLLAGGYSSAAQKVVSELADRRRVNTSPRDAAFAASFEAALAGKSDAGLRSYLSGSSAAAQGQRQLAMALLFLVHRRRGSLDAARDLANEIWREAEDVRKGLEAMGIRPFRSGQAAEKSQSRKKRAAAIR